MPMNVHISNTIICYKLQGGSKNLLSSMSLLNHINFVNLNYDVTLRYFETPCMSYQFQYSLSTNKCGKGDVYHYMDQ